MDNIAGSKSSLTWVVHISVVLLVALWLFPTVGLLVSSFRTADQIATSGWWASLFAQEQNVVMRAADPDDNRVAVGDRFQVTGTSGSWTAKAARRGAALVMWLGWRDPPRRDSPGNPARSGRGRPQPVPGAGR